jgi:hypothetical protein
MAAGRSQQADHDSKVRLRAAPAPLCRPQPAAGTPMKWHPNTLARAAQSRLVSFNFSISANRSSRRDFNISRQPACPSRTAVCSLAADLMAPGGRVGGPFGRKWALAGGAHACLRSVCSCRRRASVSSARDGYKLIYCRVIVVGADRLGAPLELLAGDLAGRPVRSLVIRACLVSGARRLA